MLSTLYAVLHFKMLLVCHSYILKFDYTIEVEVEYLFKKMQQYFFLKSSHIRKKNANSSMLLSF